MYFGASGIKGEASASFSLLLPVTNSILMSIIGMEQQVKKDIISAWNEVEEVTQNMTTFSDNDIIANKDAIIKRLNRALELLGDHFSDEESIEHLNL